MRPIDADVLFDFLTGQLEKETGAYSKGRNVGINIARSALHDKVITPNIAPPPNYPLTLEELREMGGYPVWVVPVDGKYFPKWMIVDTEAEVCRNPDRSKAMFETLGRTWNAYRRRPEEEMA